MTKQEELDKILIRHTGKTGVHLDVVKRELSKAGVVIKVESAEPPIVFSEKFTIDSKLLAMIVEKVRDTYRRAGYVVVKSLIEEQKQ